MSIIIINKGIKEPTHKYQKTSEILIFGRYVKVESLYTRFIVWVNIILNHTGIWAILPLV